MQSYIKIIGPPIAKALTALAKVADASPVVTIDPYISSSSNITPFREHVQPPSRLLKTTKLITSAEIMIGDYDFVFEWARTPTNPEMEHMMEEIDDALRPLKCNYTIETR